MIKKISVQQLKSGMFIHDLNCAWLVHPFLANSIRVDNKEIVEKVITCGMQEVYIDTDKGDDIADAPTEEEVNQEIQQELNNVIQAESKIICEVPIQEEIVKAKEIKKEAKHTIQKIMNDVRFGKNIEKGKVEEIVDGMVGSIFRNQDALLSLGMIKRSDEYTFTHSVSVCVLMLAFGRHLGYDAQMLREVGIGAMLHDIGKVKIPVEILNKEGRLSEEEIEIVREHVDHGRIILEGTPGIADISIMVAAQHHERIDGTGYPAGLRGEEISHYGQAASIIDVYDAMTSHRHYRYRVPPTEVLRKLYDWSRFYFSSDLVQQFIRCIGIYPIGSMVYLESGLIGVVVEHGIESLLHPVVRIIFDTKKQSYVRPYDVNLAQQSDEETEQKIVSYASQELWNINSEIYF